MIAGQRFGRLTVIRHDGKRSGRHFWAFTCDCGAVVVARKTHVASGATTSCGCYRRELNIATFTTHGMTGTTEYNIWTSMLARCENPKHEQFGDYGGRGISVCERWHHFAHFYADMGPRPTGLTLDRIDNDGHYEPGNVRWATWQEQAKSRRPARR